MDLIDAANANGGRDNISVVLVGVVESSGRKGLLSRILGK
jgi:protein phosphatase